VKHPSRQLRQVILAGTVILTGIAGTSQAARVPAEWADSWFRRGQKHWSVGQITEAARCYQRSIALDPLDGRPYIGLAVLYEAVSRPDLAVEELERLEQVAPDATHLGCRLAEAYLGADDVAEARRLGERAARWEPDCPRAQSVYGISLVRSRYSDTAIAALKRAVLLAPSDTGIQEVLVEAYAQKGDYAEAIRVGEPLLAEHGGSARLEYHVGLAYSRLPVTERNISAAARHLGAAAQLAPNWFQPSAELGRMYLALGRRSLAIQAFEVAWKRDSTVPGVAFNLAGLYRQLGDARAAEMARRIAALSSGGQTVTALRVQYNQQTPGPMEILRLARAEAEAGDAGTALHRVRKLLKQDPTNLKALRLYRRLDHASRVGAPEYPRPGVL